MGLRLEKKTPNGQGVNAIVKRIKKNPRAGIKIGILVGTGEHNRGDAGQTVAEIAFWNEFGTQSIPPRPFLRPTMAKNQRDYFKLVGRSISLTLLTGKVDLNTAFSIVGLKIEADIKNAIDAFSSPENSEVTQEIKGFDNPLVDTGQMKQSIKWAVI